MNAEECLKKIKEDNLDAEFTPERSAIVEAIDAWEEETK